MFFEERIVEGWLNHINPKELVACPVSFPRTALLLGRSWEKEDRDALVQLRGSKSFSSWTHGIGGRLKLFDFLSSILEK